MTVRNIINFVVHGGKSEDKASMSSMFPNVWSLSLFCRPKKSGFLFLGPILMFQKSEVGEGEGGRV